MEQILERSIEKVEKNYNVLGEEKKQVKYWYHPEFKYTTNEEIVKLIQETDMFCFGVDAVMLANFVQCNEGNKVLD